MAEQITSEGFQVVLLPAPTGLPPEEPPRYAFWAGVTWVQDAVETRAALDSSLDWLVLDHYAFDERWQAIAKPRGARLMVIDDLADRPHDCDLLLDQNLGHTSHNYDGLIPDHCQLLTGPRNALLRPEFAEQRAESLAGRQGQGVRNLLVSMGGVDAMDVTSTVLAALSKASLPLDMRICVILGRKAPAIERVQEMARSMPWPTEVVVDVCNMAKRMAHADLAIGAGGTTTWERCCLGLPSIIVEVADNQAGIANAMEKVGAGLNPGELDSSGFADRLVEAVDKLNNPVRLDAMSGAASSICDGDGAKRVVSRLLSS